MSAIRYLLMSFFCWFLLASPFFVLLLLLMSMDVAAQPVVMQTPFVPIESVGYVPVSPTSPPGTPVDTLVLLEGRDENGDTIYSTPWVPVDPVDLPGGIGDAVSSPGGASLANLLESSGLEVDRTTGDVVAPPDDPWPPWVSGDGACRRYNPFNNYGNNYSYGECMDLLAAFYGSALSNFEVRSEQGVCLDGQSDGDLEGWVPGQTDPVAGLRWTWSIIGEGCYDDLPSSGTEPEATALTSEQARELLMKPPKTNGRALPEVPPRPLTNYEYNTVINNNITNITTITTSSTTITNNYEAAGNLAAVPGGSSSLPRGLGNDVTRGIEAFCSLNPGEAVCEGVGGGGGIDCANNPDVLACQNIGDFQSDVDEALGELEDADDLLSDARTAVEDAIVEIDEYELGDGPEVGPAPSGCPLAGGIEVDGTDIVIDTTAICEATGGPVRQLIEILSYIAGAMIIMRGVTS